MRLAVFPSIFATAFFNGLVSISAIEARREPRVTFADVHVVWDGVHLLLGLETTLELLRGGQGVIQLSGGKRTTTTVDESGGIS